MPSSHWRGNDFKQRLLDALDAIASLRSYIEGMRKEQYVADRKTQSAVERELLTIAEACTKMLEMDDSIESRFSAVPWRSIRGMGNVLRHQYGRVDPVVIWDTITGQDLEHLSTALAALQ